MQPIYNVATIREADKFTIEHEPVASIDLMERASQACVSKLLDLGLTADMPVYVLCGPGNNGGDGLAIARLLCRKGFSVNVYIPDPDEKYSEDFSINLDRLKNMQTEVGFLENFEFEQVEDNAMLIDALFGSGLSRKLTGIYADSVVKFNKAEGYKVSVDVPSGLYCDSLTDSELVVKADVTLTFQYVKLAFLISENEEYAGEWHVLDIGLSADFFQTGKTQDYLIEKDDIQFIIKPRSRFGHKGTYGHALLMCGSKGKMGAAVLASRACLRSGAGLVSAYVPACGYEIIQTTVPESMTMVSETKDYLSKLPDIEPFSAIGIGPGTGKAEETANLLKLLIQQSKVPLVLDADALNILSENKTWLAYLPENSILTPHPGEFERLAGKSANSFERLQLLREFCIRYKLYIVLKGAYSVICTPLGKCFFNPTGNPGMATGGSGDVLSGIITSLLAQHYSTLDACIAGVYLHGLAGDIAAENLGENSLIAGDIIDYLPDAFQDVMLQE